MTEIPSPRRNIKRRVTWCLFFTTIAIFALTEFLILELSYKSLQKSLDSDLLTRAKALASLAEAEPDGKIDFDFVDEIMPDYSGKDPRAYFLICRADNSEIERSLSMKSIDMKISDSIFRRSFGKTYFWNENTDQGKIRFLALNETIRWEDDLEEEEWKYQNPQMSDKTSGSSINKIAERQNVKCLFIVGINTREIDARFLNIFQLTSISLTFGLMLLLFMSRYIVRQNLRCLNEFNEIVQSISPSNLSPVTIPPVDEIAPIAETLNSVLIELQNAFKHERQFTSHVAHELRTPICEIRSLAEVAVKWPEKLDEESLRFFINILETVVHMQYMVENLLTLSQSDNGQLEISPSSVDMIELLNNSLDFWIKSASEKNIDLTCQIPDRCSIYSDSHLIRMILDNLLMNAVEYSKPGSQIKVGLNQEDDHFMIQISNHPIDLEDEDLPHLSDRFWQKDAVRSSNNSSCGLGLSIVSDLSQLLGFDIETELTEKSVFTIFISGKTEINR